MQRIKFEATTTEIIPLASLQNNTGQIPGLPANPRKIDADNLPISHVQSERARFVMARASL